MTFIRFSKSLHSPKQPKMTTSDLSKGPGWGIRGKGCRELTRAQEEVLSPDWWVEQAHAVLRLPDSRGYGCPGLLLARAEDMARALCCFSQL